MEKKTIAYSALGAVGVALLTLFGTNLFDGTHYYCAEKNLSMKCDHFSASGTRCYPQPLVTTGYKDCPTPWALIVNDTPKETPVPIQEPPKQVFTGKREAYACNQGCEAI